MPLGIVSDEDFEKDLRNIGIKKEEDPTEIREEESGEFPTIPISEILSGEVLVPPALGRGNNKETPEILRKLVGEEYAIEGRENGKELAASFGLSPSSASAYGHGNTSTASYNKPSPAIEDFLQKRKGRIIKKSSAKIMEAIDAIDGKKIAEAPAGVLAGIAKSLSGVIRDLEPPAKTEEKVQQVQFIMYAPRLISESSLETIQVNE